MVPEQLAHTSSFVSLVTELDKICQAGEAGSVSTASQFWQLKTAYILDTLWLLCDVGLRTIKETFDVQ